MRLKFILFLFIILSFQLKAQDDQISNSTEQWPSTQLGFKIGYVNSTVYGSQIDNYSKFGYEFNSRNGTSIGLQTKLNIFKWWYMKFELNLFQKGAEIEESNYVYPPKPYFTYLNIPVITGFRIEAIPDVMKIGFEVGVASNIEVSNQENLDKGLYPTIYPRYDKHIIDFNYGMDMEYTINKQFSLSTNLRFFKDLDAFFQRIDYFPIYESGEEEIEFYVSEMKHKGWNLNFTLNYTIRKK